MKNCKNKCSVSLIAGITLAAALGIYLAACKNGKCKKKKNKRGKKNKKEEVNPEIISGTR